MMNAIDPIPKRPVRKSAKASQRGFSIVAAIFLIVVLAGLAVAMVSISTVHQSSSALDVLGARAYQAARAGIQWGLFQRLRGTNRANYCANASAPVATTTFAMPITLPSNSLSPFTVTVVCSLNVIATTNVQALAGVVTVDTAIDHHLIVGDQISMGGVAPAQFNGNAIVVTEVTAANAFRYALAGASGVASAQGVFTRGAALDRWTIQATACNQPNAVTGCPNPSPRGDYVQRVMRTEL